MPVDYGRSFLNKTGRDVMVIADGDLGGAKTHGISLDATTIPTNATGSPLVLADDTIVAVGQAYMRYGQIVCRITATGLYGPYDPAATASGRDTLRRGECFFLNRTWLDVPAGFPFAAGQGSLHPPVFDKGLVWYERLLITTGTHSLAAGPTVAEFEAAFPRVGYFKN